MNNRYVSEYEENIKENAKILLKAVNNINQNTPLETVKKLVYDFCYTSTGLYVSEKIESYLLNISQNIKADLHNEYEKNSVLHVMTMTYDSGGHTRVVERWIENALENEVHSLFLTNQSEEEINKNLKTIIENQKGNIYYNKNNDDIKTAIKLRQTASRYGRIVLHVHMEDIVPVLAFGTEEFKRPVLFYNHADHLAWVGVSIADKILELRDFGVNITKNKRGCSRQYKLGIPTYKPQQQSYKTRDELGLPKDKTIIFSCGSEFKYFPVQDINIFNLIKSITDKYNVLFILVGITNLSQFHIEQYNINNDRLKIIGRMEHNKLMSYIYNADIVVDSFPMSGATALLDAYALKKPLLSGCSLVGQLNYIAKSQYYCETVTEMIRKLEILIENKKEQEENVKEINHLVEENDSLECFIKNLHEIRNIEDENHRVYKIGDIVDKNLIDNDVYRFIFNTNKKVKVKLGFLQINKYENNIRKWHEIKIFGKKFRITLKKYK